MILPKQGTTNNKLEVVIDPFIIDEHCIAIKDGESYVVCMNPQEAGDLASQIGFALQDYERTKDGQRQV